MHHVTAATDDDCRNARDAGQRAVMRALTRAQRVGDNDGSVDQGEEPSDRAD